MELAKLAFFVISLYSAHLTVAAPLCQDKHDQCSDYASYCGSYDNVRKQCPRTCNQCALIYPSLSVTPTQSLPTGATPHTFAPLQSSMAALGSLATEQIATSLSQVPSRTQTSKAFSCSLTQTRASHLVSQTQNLNDFTTAQSPREVLPGSTSLPTETTDYTSEPNICEEDGDKEQNTAIRTDGSSANILMILTVSRMYAFL